MKHLIISPVAVVLMVHVVIGRQYSAYIDSYISAGTSIIEIMEMESKFNSQLDSDEFRCFDHRDKFDSTV